MGYDERMNSEKPWKPSDRVRRKIQRKLGRPTDARSMASLDRSLRGDPADRARAEAIASEHARRTSEAKARRLNGG